MDTFKKHLHRDPPPAFRDALNHALLAHAIAKLGIQSEANDLKGHVSPPALPKRIRANLKRTKGAALRLNDRINELDGNSRQLVAESGGLTELYDLVARAIRIINAAEVLANEYPRSRATIKDYSSRYLTAGLARALYHFCGEAALAPTREGLFHQVLLILFGALGEPNQDRINTMKRGLQHFQEVRQRGELGPPLSWEDERARKEPPIIWSMAIGTPSMNKSPGLDAVLMPLRSVERQARNEISLDLSEWRDKAEVARLVEQAWREAVKVAHKEGKNVPPRPAEANPGDEPVMLRLMVTDATVEKIAVIIEKQPRV